MADLNSVKEPLSVSMSCDAISAMRRGTASTKLVVEFRSVRISASVGVVGNMFKHCNSATRVCADARTSFNCWMNLLMSSSKLMIDDLASIITCGAVCVGSGACQFASTNVVGVDSLATLAVLVDAMEVVFVEMAGEIVVRVRDVDLGIFEGGTKTARTSISLFGVSLRPCDICTSCGNVCTAYSYKAPTTMLGTLRCNCCVMSSFAAAATIEYRMKSLEISIRFNHISVALSHSWIFSAQKIGRKRGTAVTGSIRTL